jgi:integrase
MTNLTFGQLAAPFFTKDCPRLAEFSAYGRKLSPYYINDKRRLIKCHILSDSELCRIPIDQLKGMHIKQYIARKGAIYSGRAIMVKIVKVIKLILKEFYIQGYIDRPIGDMIRTMTATKKVDRGALTAAEMERIQAPENFDSTEKQALFTTTVLCGMRYGEVTALRWQDINFDKNTITIAQAWKEKDILGTPKSGKIRAIWLPSAVKRLLTALKKPTFEQHEFIFKGVKGPKPSNYWINRQFRLILAKAGIDCQGRNLSFHSLRHTLKSFMAAKGIPIEIQQKIFGWSDSGLKQMAANYTHVDTDFFKDYLAICGL